MQTTIIQAAQNMIIVDGRPIIMVDFENDFKMYVLKLDKKGKPVMNKQDEFIADILITDEKIELPGLYQILTARREHYEKLAANMGRTFKGEVTIMCDKEMPYIILKRVMATAGKSGFGDFKFAAFRREEG
jgi:hypothetical protein